MSQTQIIDAKQIGAMIPPNLRPLLSLSVCRPIAEPEFPVIHAFVVALKALYRKVRARRVIHVVFGAPPFVLKLKTGTLSYEPNGDVINCHVEDFVFLNVEKLAKLPFAFQVTCILEEFVHAVMHVGNEDMTTHVVALLYDGVKVVDGKYHLAGGA